MSMSSRRRLLVDENVAAAMEITRFWFNVAPENEDGCRPWIGDTFGDGYGLFTWRGRRFPAHELALTFATGEIRDETLDTCHSCNVPLCCNPAHLRFDTRKSNVADCISAGRHPWQGERNPSAKLTKGDVETMRNRRANGARVKDLADHYGVTNGLVSEICRGLRWRTAGGPIVESAGTGPNPKNRKPSWHLITR